MQTHDISAPWAQIKEALGEKIGTELDADELQAELQKYLDYGVPADQAVRTILRHHGVAGAAPGPVVPASNGERVQLANLPGNVPAVNLMARIISLNTKTVQARGEAKEIYWGMLGDETATRSFTSWKPLEGLEKGDVIAVQGAYTKEWRGEVQINFGDRTMFEKQADDAIPKTPETFRDVDIAEISAGDRGIQVTGRILDISSRQVNVQGESKTIFGGTIADETGKIEFTAWSDPGIETDQIVSIAGGYVRAYRGVPQLNFDSDATIKPADVELPDADTLADTPPVELCTLMEHGGNDVTVVATLLEVRDGSGLVFRDPETNRVVHGSQIKDDCVPDLRIKGVLDDGTAAMSLIANKELTEALLGKNLEECQAMAKEAFRSEVVQEKLQATLTGRVYKVQGNVLVDEFGAMFIARSVRPFAAECEEEAQTLMDQLEGDGATVAAPETEVL
jgi:replication factor A1